MRIWVMLSCDSDQEPHKQGFSKVPHIQYDVIHDHGQDQADRSFCFLLTMGPVVNPEPSFLQMGQHR